MPSPPLHCPLPPGPEGHICEMLFIDYSSAFNTIVPSKLVTKLRDLGLNSASVIGSLNFLTADPQAVQRMGSTTSSTLTLNTGAAFRASPLGTAAAPASTGEDDLQDPAAHHADLLCLCCHFVCSSLSLSVSSTGTFVVNVTQSSYQAEENQNITLEWTFTIKKETPLTSLYILCELFTEDHLKHFPLFQLHEGVEVPESQDEHFAGRVQFDKDVLREGRIRLHVSRLRTDDSGLYPV
ncbi:hypothetical protein L3Q82_016647 [Scortum barcoo]|uniref:Uncharacterized protein n=1 Tax=Scortum barcoo TaxID=214431 RepID=A0ACB8X7M0_9TELE|nr:hypothetical protein L3Q82_016647 [Scortum barcoo]